VLYKAVTSAFTTFKPPYFFKFLRHFQNYTLSLAAVPCLLILISFKPYISLRGSIQSTQHNIKTQNQYSY
jgi:CHASE3 domain sensor protein